MKKLSILKKIGEKTAMKSTAASCIPLYGYQPKPPAKIQAKMMENK